VELFSTPVDEDVRTEESDHLDFRKLRYTANYSHWEQWEPNDDVTLAEVSIKT
jgi:hypothetical protein